MIRVLMVAWLLAGCAFRPPRTQPVASFGYRGPVRVAVVRVPSTDSGAGLASDAAARMAAVATVIADETSSLREPGTAWLCHRAGVLAAAGQAIHAVVAPSAKVTTASVPGPCRDRRDGEAECSIAGYRVSVVVTIRIVDTATCGDQVYAIGSGTHVRPDEPSATAAAVAVAAQRLAGFDPFRRGLEPVAASGRMIEVEGPGLAALTPARVLVVTGRPAGPTGRLGKVRVVRNDGRRALLEAERDRLGLGPGDELGIDFLGDRQWLVLPVASVGATLRGDAHVTAGAGVEVRWSSEPYKLMATATLGRQTYVDDDLVRDELAVAAGFKWQRGPIAPYLLGDAGGLFALTRGAANRGRFTDGNYLGLGTGLELTLWRVVLVGDVRWHSMSQRFEGDAKDATFDQLVVKVGAAMSW